MGRLIIISVTDVMSNPDIKMRFSVVGNTQTCELKFLKAVGEMEPASFIFWLSVGNNGTIELEKDYNVYGSSFLPLTAHLHYQGIPHRVV